MNMQNLMKQAQQMQSQMAKIEQELESTLYDGSSGGDAVKVVINGKHSVIEVNINEDVMDRENRSMLEDLIMTAMNQAVEKADRDREDKLKAITQGLSFPGGL